MMWTPQKTINNKYDRIIALIDMDCKFSIVSSMENLPKINLRDRIIINIHVVSSNRFLLSSRRAIESESKGKTNNCTTTSV